MWRLGRKCLQQRALTITQHFISLSPCISTMLPPHFQTIPPSYSVSHTSSFPKNNLTWKIMCYQSLYFFNPKLSKECFKSTNAKHRLNTEWRRTGAGSYPLIFPLFGLLTAQQEGLPVCGCPLRRGLENHLQTWPLRNQQMLQRGVLCGHPSWAVGSGTASGFLSAKQSISLLVYWNQSVGGKTIKEKKEEVQFFKFWYAGGHLCRLFRKSVLGHSAAVFMVIYPHCKFCC